VTQCFATRHVLRWLGVGLTLCIVPLVSGIGLGVLSAAPMLAVVVGVDVVRRAAAFSLEVPARGVLFTVTTRAEKYKAKGFIDTVIYRGGDYVGAALFKGLTAWTGGIAHACLTTTPIVLLFGLLGFGLGREQRRREALRSADAQNPESPGRRFSPTSQ
jgi:ATP:ADP antiporter, AAA family